MASGVKVDWRVPSKEWDRFVEHIHSEYGTIEGYVGREVEAAMREWVDLDGGNETEELVSRLVRAAGRTPEDISQKKRTPTSDLSGDDGETTRVTCRVHPDVKDEFKRYTKKHADNRVGVELAHAINTRRHGGRWQRIEDKLSRVVDDAEGLLSELDDESSKSLTSGEKRTIEICRRLPDEFTENDLHEEIKDVAGDSSPTIRTYTERVTERRDAVLHPNNNKLYIPRAKAEEIAESSETPSPDAPAIDRKDYTDLTREEKIQGVQITLARQSLKSTTPGDGCRLDSKKINRMAFNGTPAQSHVLDLMEAAGNAAGFKFCNPHGTKKLQVTRGQITDEAILRAIDERPSAGEDDIDSEVGRQMDQLTNARQVRADGGEAQN